MSELIRVSTPVKEELESIREEEEHTTLDSVLRDLLNKRERLIAES